MSRYLYLLIPSLFVSMAQAESKGAVVQDVCQIRPDLCGGAPKKKSKKAKARVSVKSKTCYEDGEELELSDSLPPCKKRKTEVSMKEILSQKGESIADPSYNSNARAPASVSFSDYLKNNSSHPALSGSLASRQAAFEYRTRAAISPTVSEVKTIDPAQSSSTAAGSEANTPSQSVREGEQPATSGVQSPGN